MEFSKPHLVIDIGSATVRAGFSGEEAPLCVFPNVIGRPKNKGIMVGSETKDYYVGTQADEKRGVLTLSYPVEQGIVQEWDDWEKIVEHTFTNELRVKHDEHPVLVTLSPLNSRENKETLTALLFNMFRVPALYVASPPVLALHAAGKSTGIVVDCGGAATLVVSVFDGYALANATLQGNVAGSNITDALIKLLSERGLSFTTSVEREIVTDIKEKHCYVALDFDQEMNTFKTGALPEVPYEMPDGAMITIGSERFRAPEVLFRPSLIGSESQGLPALVYSAVMKSDPELRAELLNNIVLTGGSSALPGLPERLAREVQKLVPPHLSSHVKVTAGPAPKDDAWRGGSILSTASGFSPMWITQQDYEDAGPAMVHRKCF